jgi:hypothetical protein
MILLLLLIRHKVFYEKFLGARPQFVTCHGSFVCFEKQTSNMTTDILFSQAESQQTY